MTLQQTIEMLLTINMFMNSVIVIFGVIPYIKNNREAIHSIDNVLQTQNQINGVSESLFKDYARKLN